MHLDTKVREKQIYNVTIIGSIVNLLLLIIKFYVGFIGNSKAMVADAVHSLSDFFTDLVVIVMVKIANKPRDDDHAYGHAKYETLATLVIGIILLFVGAGIAYNSVIVIIKFAHGEIIPRPGIYVLVIAILSIITKELLYRYTIIQGKKLKSEALIANAWHHRSDAFSSIGTTIGIGGAIILGNMWTILDPLAALVVSYIIVVMALKLMKSSIDELLEISLSDEIKMQITYLVNSHPDVSDMHHLRTRKIGNIYAIEFHLRMDGETSLTIAHDRITEIENMIKETYGQETHVNIHIEPVI